MDVNWIPQRLVLEMGSIFEGAAVDLGEVGVQVAEGVRVNIAAGLRMGPLPSGFTGKKCPQEGEPGAPEQRGGRWLVITAVSATAADPTVWPSWVRMRRGWRPPKVCSTVLWKTTWSHKSPLPRKQQPVTWLTVSAGLWKLPGGCPFRRPCSHGDEDQTSERSLSSPLDGGRVGSLAQSRFGQKPLVKKQKRKSEHVIAMAVFTHVLYPGQALLKISPAIFQTEVAKKKRKEKKRLFSCCNSTALW